MCISRIKVKAFCQSVNDNNLIWTERQWVVACILENNGISNSVVLLDISIHLQYISRLCVKFQVRLYVNIARRRLAESSHQCQWKVFAMLAVFIMTQLRHRYYFQEIKPCQIIEFPKNSFQVTFCFTEIHYFWESLILECFHSFLISLWCNTCYIVILYRFA